MYLIQHGGMPSKVREQKTGKWEGQQGRISGWQEKETTKETPKIKADIEVHMGKKR